MIRLSFAAPISFVWLTLTMVGCGPCDDFHQVALSSLPPDTLAADRKLFDRHFGGSFDVHIIPERLAHHPETEKLFEELGYTRRDRDVIVFTSLGLKKSDWHRFGEATFPIARTEAEPFFKVMEGHLCDGGHTSNRVYYYHESVTSLTLLGKTLLDAGQLSYGESSTDVGRRKWSGPQQRLIGRFLFQTDDPADTVSIGGDDISLPWAKE